MRYAKGVRLARRAVLGGLAGLGLAPRISAAAEQGASHPGAGTALPARGEILIRGAHVLTMDPDIGDLSGADVHVRDGEIVDVGPGLAAREAEVIDGTNCIILPGFVDTHWHMWNALLRSMAGDKEGRGYFPMRTALGKAYRPEDTFAGTRLAAAEALFSGITFVHNWAHNIRSPQHAEADIRALRESGIRARFSYGPAAGQPRDEPIDLDHLEALHSNWDSIAPEGRLDLGLAWGGPYAESGRREYDTARRLGLPISIHAGSAPAQAGQIAELAEGGYLDPDVQIIHATAATDKDIAAMAEAGSPVSLSPFTEMRIGFGLPPIVRLLEAGVTTGLSVDTTALSGNADMFAIMKALQNLGNGRVNDEFRVSPRRMLALATIEGARSMGVADRVGSLTPGKRADLNVVSLDALNLGYMTQPDHLLVEAARPENIDTVMVDGRILKRGGRLTALDAGAVTAGAAEAFANVKDWAGWE